MKNLKFKAGQVVSFRSVGKKSRKGGVITNAEKMYELKQENKRYYSDDTCRGELTTLKYLSNNEFKGYAYRCKTIQPSGFTTEIVIVEEFKLTSSTKEKVLNSYTIY